MIKPSENTERRTQRSPWPSAALCLQLAQTAARHRLSAFVLADRGGNLWASCSSEPREEELAAAIPRLQLVPGRDGLVRGGTGHSAVCVKPIAVGETTLYLIAQGRRSAAGLREAALGIARILGALRA